MSSVDAILGSARPTAGTAARFEDCYRAHWRTVYRLCLRYGGGDASWAEDVTHDVFVKLLERLEELDDPDDVGGWLYRVAANQAISALRRQRSLLGRLSRLLTAAPLRKEPTAEDLLSTKETAARALETLRELPPQERVVLCMKLLDGRSQREIATALGLSEGTSRSWCIAG